MPAVRNRWADDLPAGHDLPPFTSCHEFEETRPPNAECGVFLHTSAISFKPFLDGGELASGRLPQPEPNLTNTDLVERLAQHKTLRSAPREELEWLAAHGTVRVLE